jgi:hypothetical protein
MIQQPAMNLTAPIANKISKLIRMLSSQEDGEVLGAVRALRRTLQANKLDIHALAKRIENGGGFDEHESREHYRAGFMAGLQAANQAQSSGRYEPPSWAEMARACQKQAHRLTERERKFVNNMAARTVYGDLSEAQGKWLESIFYRLGGGRM